MITNINKIIIPTVHALLISPHAFHLTGSRLFGNAKPTSDYDFFTQDTSEVRRFLEEIGFSNNYSPLTEYPDDPNIAEVLTYGIVQVQLVKDAALKLAAQEILLDLPAIPWEYARALGGDKKVMARRWWIWAFNKAKKGKK